MEIARHVLVLLHLVGFASLFGGLLVQSRSAQPEVNASMLHGSWTLLVTGIGLVALLELEGGPLDRVKVAVKLVLTIFVVVLVAKNRKFSSIPRGLWGLLGGMTFANAAIAVLWR